MAEAIFESNSGTLLNLKIYIKTTPIPNENSSRVNVRGVLCYSRINVSSRSNQYLSIADVDYSYNTPAIQVSTTGANTTELFNRTVTVPHDSNGRKTIYVAATYAFNGTYSKVPINTLYATGIITLDNLDRSPPSLFGIWINQVTQNSIAVHFNSYDNLDYVWYSLDGGATFNDLPTTNIIRGLSPNTTYNVVLRVRKTNNGMTTVSQIIQTTTLPIYLTSITLPDSITLDEWESRDFQVDFQPRNASIKSASPIINGHNIWISSHTVTGKEKGVTKFRFVANDGSNIVSNDCTVTVIRRVNGLYVSAEEAIVELNTYYKINYGVMPSNATNLRVSFHSSNTAVAEVDSEGNLYAKGLGACSVTVISDDGGYRASINITVTVDVSWIPMNGVPEIVNYWDINNLYQNQTYIYLKLIQQNPDFSLTRINCTGFEWLSQMHGIYSDIHNNMNALYNCVFSKPLTEVTWKTEPDYMLYKEWINALNQMKAAVDE